MQTGRCTYGPIGRRRRRVREGELLKAMYRFGMSWCGCACRAVSRGCPRWAGRSMGRGERRRADRRHSYSGGTVNTPHTTTGRDTLEVRGPDSYRTDYRIRYKDLEKSKNKTPDGKFKVSRGRAVCTSETSHVRDDSASNRTELRMEDMMSVRSRPDRMSCRPIFDLSRVRRSKSDDRVNVPYGKTDERNEVTTLSYAVPYRYDARWLR
jgi:hypothetical protein